MRNCGGSCTQGTWVILTRLQALREFVDYTREELAGLFSPHDPEHVHEHIDPPEMAKYPKQVEAPLHPRRAVKEAGQGDRRRGGLHAHETHYDLPKPRTSFPSGHLTTGVAFAFPWHRDTWYSAPAQQVNWWLPIFPVRADNAMTFDLASFDRAVPNTSGAFDYYENNARRLTTQTGVTREAQARPGAVDHRAAQDLVILPAPGEVLLFSGNQLHASTPNTSGSSRYSVDFRTVSVPDLMAWLWRSPRRRRLHRDRDQGLRQRRRREPFRRAGDYRCVRPTAGRCDARVRVTTREFPDSRKGVISRGTCEFRVLTARDVFARFQACHTKVFCGIRRGAARPYYDPAPILRETPDRGELITVQRFQATKVPDARYPG